VGDNGTGRDRCCSAVLIEFAVAKFGKIFRTWFEGIYDHDTWLLRKKSNGSTIGQRMGGKNILDELFDLQTALDRYLAGDDLGR